MRAVMLEVPPALLEQRRRTGADRWDEMWEGILHMVPPPSGHHQLFGTYLLHALLPAATASGLVGVYEIGIFRSVDDYRQPDLVFARREFITRRGLEGPAQLVVEVLSQGDESREKLSFYAAMLVREVLLVDPDTRQFELLRLVGDGYTPVVANGDDEVQCEAIDAWFSTVAGPRFRVRTSDAVSEI
jgi:Uma2 family endonuclease